ncbi:S-phase kinase-associated protein 2-like [Drosophila tropicalis]|uniref:S-phase kinase-associated protein 2-like n=1 Tax=Drosophila tropicalis TaxID=46794 RepID=UPI0035AB9DF4
MDDFDSFYGCSLKTHYKRKGLCYTEDNIPVQKLFLSNIPKDLKKDTLVKHFNTFGGVQSVQIFYKVKQPSMRMGFVLFANVIGAARALKNSSHRVNGHKINVLSAHTWQQPEIYGASEPTTAGDESGEAYILKIPDDCLLMIIDFLPLADQLFFQRVCQRFRSIYQLATRCKYKTVDYQMFENRSHWYIREFFHILGPNVQHLNGSLRQRSIFKGPLLKCFGGNLINLKSLNLSGAKLTKDNLTKIFSSTNKLEELMLDHCRLADESLLALKDLKNLKTLNLAFNNSLSGLNLEKLPISIESLNLSFCFKIQPDPIIQMCESLTKLLNLSIAGVDPKTNDRNFYNNLVKPNRCLSLQVLSISTYDQCEDIAELPNLKKIHIANEMPEIFINTGLFDQLAIFKSQQLEELKIDDANRINKQMLLQIAKLTGLKTLWLYNVTDVDDDVVEAFTNLKKLERINFDRGYFSDYNILRLVLECPKLKELDLRFSPNITRKLVDDLIVKIPCYYKKNDREFPIILCLADIQYYDCPYEAPGQDIVKILCHHNYL